jgi:hypothetical protein
MSAYYHCFTSDHDLSAAHAAFYARYGCQPAETLRWSGGVLAVGPVPEEQAAQAEQAAEGKAEA